MEFELFGIPIYLGATDETIMMVIGYRNYWFKESVVFADPAKRAWTAS
jgi:hypothetical protein